MTLEAALAAMDAEEGEENEVIVGSQSESEEDEDTGLTENQNRLLYMISLYTKKATPHTDEKDEWVSFGSAASLSSNFPVTTDFNLSVSPFDLLYLRR